jgi:hypothetical protein
VNVSGFILIFIGVVLIFSGFRGTYKNWYSAFTGTTGTAA